MNANKDEISDFAIGQWGVSKNFFETINSSLASTITKMTKMAINDLSFKYDINNQLKINTLIVIKLLSYNKMCRDKMLYFKIYDSLLEVIQYEKKSSSRDFILDCLTSLSYELVDIIEKSNIQDLSEYLLNEPMDDNIEYKYSLKTTKSKRKFNCHVTFSNSKTATSKEIQVPVGNSNNSLNFINDNYENQIHIVKSLSSSVLKVVSSVLQDYTSTEPNDRLHLLFTASLLLNDNFLRQESLKTRIYDLRIYDQLIENFQFERYPS